MAIKLSKVFLLGLVILTGPFAISDDRCGIERFQKEYNLAFLSAVQDMKNNLRFQFHGEVTKNLSGLDNDIYFVKPKHWQSIECSNQQHCYIPKDGKSFEALDEIPNTPIFAECQNALTLVQNLAVSRLLEKDSVQKNFTEKEFYVGTDVEHSDSLLFGSDLSWDDDSNGIERAEMGPAYWVGASGYIGPIYEDESYLDDLDARGQNFQVVETSDYALQGFIQRGGWSGYKRRLKHFWKTASPLSDDQKLLLQELLDDGVWDPEIEKKAVKAKIPQSVVLMLMDPLLLDTLVYVHPVGVQSLAWHLIRQARKNPRTPYDIIFYPNSIHEKLFPRWQNSHGEDLCSSKN